MDQGPVQLNLWPMPVVAAAFLLAALGATLLVGALGRQFSPYRSDSEAQVVAFDIAKVIGGVVGLFLIFVLTQSMSYYREAEVAVSKEAGDILQLDHALAGVPAARGAPARVQLQAYTRSVIEQEWPAMRRGRASEATEQVLARLQLAVAEVLEADPAAAALRNVQKNLDDIEDDRTARTGTSESGLPAALWRTASILFGLFAIVMFIMAPAAPQFRLFAIYVACLALLASLLYMVDGPYLGEFSVSPRPLQRALSRMVGS